MLNLSRICAIFLVLTAFGDPDLAQAQSKEGQPRNKKGPTAENKTGVDTDVSRDELRDDSASNRTKFGHNTSVLAFLAADFLLNYGVSYEYSLSPDLRLTGTFASGSDTLGGVSNESYRSSDIDVSGMAFWVSARKFIGNSFNVSGGLGWRRASASAELINRTTLAKTSFEWMISSLTIPVAIGNHWQWSNGMSVGVDWIGAQIGFAGTAKVEIDSAEVTTGLEDIENDLEKSGSDIANGVGLTLATLALGLSF